MRVFYSINRFRTWLALGLAWGCLGAAWGHEGTDLREVGRRLAEQYGPAVLTVQIVITMGDEASGDELKSECIGTVIAPDGLTLIPLSAIDPGSLLNNMGPMSMMMPDMQSRVKDLKLLVGKRKEIPATVVRRDSDLNMAFIRPLEKPEEPMPYIDLADSAAAEMLDPIITLARMGKIANRELRLASGEIHAIVKKPRKFYVPQMSLSGLGVPVFTAQGKLIGILLSRTSPGGIDDMMGGALNLDFIRMIGVLPIILPAEDVLEVAQQADEEAPAEQAGTQPVDEETAVPSESSEASDQPQP